MSLKLVSDASPLILLSAIERLGLLHALASRVAVPRQVFEEVLAGGSQDATAAQLQALQWIEHVEVGEIPTAVAAWDLGAGEAAVLAWAAQQEGWTALLDDGAARRCGEALGIGVIGTLGIIVTSKRIGLIPAARPLVDELFRRGYYLDRSIAESSLHLVDE